MATGSRPFAAPLLGLVWSVAIAHSAEQRLVSRFFSWFFYELQVVTGFEHAKDDTGSTRKAEFLFSGVFS